jgi:nucleoside-diphosphate-sugar epimerase
MKRVLITGANGFVGRTLCEVMLTKDWQVRGIVRSAKDMACLPTGVEAVQIQSIGLDTDWSDALNGVHAVVHLAARVHVMNDTAADPITEFRQVNVSGSERLALMAAKAGVRRLIYLSSVKVNGEGGDISYAEQDKPAPEDPYGVSKMEAERVLQKIAAATGLELVIIRPPLIYGPGVKANFLTMVKIVERGFPLPLASIHNHRSFISLDNLVSAIMTCVCHPKAAGQTYLVSDNEDVSTPDLIRRIAAALGKAPKLFPCPPKLLLAAGRLTGKLAAVERLVGSLTVDTQKIYRELGWVAPYTMQQGLTATADWYRHRANS